MVVVWQTQKQYFYHLYQVIAVSLGKSVKREVKKYVKNLL